MNSASTIPGSYQHQQYRMRLMAAMTISILFHAFMMSLQFGIPGLGLPGLAFPWNERRARDAELSVRLSNAKAVPEAQAQSTNDKPNLGTRAADLAARPERQRSSKRRRNEASSDAPAASDRTEVGPLSQAPDFPSPALGSAPVGVVVEPAPEAATIPIPGPLPPHGKSQQPIIAHSDERESAFVVPPPSSEEYKQQAAAVETVERPSGSPRASTPPEELTIDARDQEEANAKLKAMALEATRQAEEAARDAGRKLSEEESARHASEMAARKQEERKQEEENAQRRAAELAAQVRADEVDRQQAAALAIRKEQQAAQQREQEEEARRAQQLEAKAEEEKRQARAEQEAIELEARREAEEAVRDAALVARQKQAAQLAAAERAQEVAARQKAEAAIGEQRERDRMIADDALAKAAPPGEVSRRAEPPTLPRNLSGDDLVSRALQQARQLDAPRSEPKAIPEPVERTESPRRRTLLGSEQDIGLRMYFESWRLKIERNGNLNYTQSSKDRARGHPVVTVVIRSDGSVDGVFINRSSGVPELDEAVRRIVQLNARYSAFPPELARRYDVIEIRRTWNFEDTLRILEEVR